jgi:hypothetical protein
MRETLVFRVLEGHAMANEFAAATERSSTTAIRERYALIRRQREFMNAAIPEQMQYPRLSSTTVVDRRWVGETRAFGNDSEERGIDASFAIATSGADVQRRAILARVVD